MPKHDLVYDFALRLAVAIDDVKSSHVFFVMQKAFGEALDWRDVEKKLGEIIALCKCGSCKNTIKKVRHNLKS